MSNIGFFIFFLSINFVAFGQSLTSKRYVKTDSFKCEFYVTDKKVKEFNIQDSLTYHWCKAQKIFETQGGASGKIIDGSFLKFYHSGQLAEKGLFKMGLKHGEWKTWFASGKLRSIYRYRYGKRQGKFVVYKSDGTVLAFGKYKRDKLKHKKVKEEKIKEDKPDKLAKEHPIWYRIKSFFPSKNKKN